MSDDKISDDVAKWLDKEQSSLDKERERSRFIKLAINFEDRESLIPEWDYESHENLWEHITQEEEFALRYVTDHEIDLKPYRADLVKPQSIPYQHQNDLDPITLNDALTKYLNVKKKNNLSEKSATSYRDNINLFIEIINVKDGKDLATSKIDFYIDNIEKIPTNRKKVKEFRDIPLKQILSMDIDESKTLSESTVSAHATNVKMFLDWGIKRKYFATGLSLPLEDVFKNPTTYPYLAFSTDDLTRLFNSNEYVKDLHKNSINYWGPLIGLYTGAREKEICQLYTSDIKVYKSRDNSVIIPYFDINFEDDKTLKTKSSHRLIPIHSVLKKLGFLEYVESLKTNGEVRLFDESRKIEQVTRALSRWFNESYRPNCGVASSKPDKRKVFHSFRHTLTQNIRHNAKDIPLDKIGEIIGHASDSTVGKHYAGTLHLEDKQEVIEKAAYDFDLRIIRKWGSLASHRSK